MFKLEPIVDASFNIWGYEALLSLDIPNPYIFAVPNPVLELYILDQFVHNYSRQLEKNRFTFNLSVFAIVIGSLNLKKLLSKYPNLYIEITEHALLLPPSRITSQNEWFQILANLMQDFPKRFLLDDYMEGKTFSLYQTLKEYWFAVKISIQILNQINSLSLNNTLIIAEKVETEEDFLTVRNKANLFQGFYFKNKTEVL